MRVRDRRSPGVETRAGQSCAPLLADDEMQPYMTAAYKTYPEESDQMLTVPLGANALAIFDGASGSDESPRTWPSLVSGHGCSGQKRDRVTVSDGRVPGRRVPLQGSS